MCWCLNSSHLCLYLLTFSLTLLFTFFFSIFHYSFCRGTNDLLFSSISFSKLLAVLTLFLQLAVFSLIVDTYGILRVYRFGCNLFAFAVFMMPMISYLKGHTDSPESVWIVVVTSLTLMGWSMMLTTITVFILINNSCYSHERATVNGIGQVFVSFGRLCAPLFVYYSLSWTRTNENGRTDWALNYLVLGAISLMNSRLALLLPRSIERRRREPREPRYAYSTTDRGIEDPYDEGPSEMEDLIAEEEVEQDHDHDERESSIYPTQQGEQSLSAMDNLQNDRSTVLKGHDGLSGGEDEFNEGVTSRSL